MATLRSDKPGTPLEQQGSEIGERIQGALDDAQSRLSDAGARLTRSASRARELASERVESLTELMQRHPIATIAIGLGVGFVIGRLMARD
ncbi:MAG TPA: hypothetical protein VM734_09965 [Kofleriaceae bacterium]|nr:hypothetical protein [Kofleriaceae bacterium]